VLAAYGGDTWGTLWRFTLGSVPASVLGPSCSQPLHYAPAVVQLDRDDFTAHRTRSTCAGHQLGARQRHQGLRGVEIIFRRDIVNSGTVVADTTFGTSGALTLTVGSTGDVRDHRFERACVTMLPRRRGPWARRS